MSFEVALIAWSPSGAIKLVGRLPDGDLVEIVRDRLRRQIDESATVSNPTDTAGEEEIH